MAWYIRSGLDRESGSQDLLEPKAAAPADSGGAGLRWLLGGLAANLILSIPVLARPPFSLDQGHSLTQWLAEFLSPWLRWVGLTQLVYLGPMHRRLGSSGRPQAAKALARAAGMTLAVSGLAWSAHIPGRDASFSLQAACGLLALACIVALLWLARELRRSLEGGQCL